MSEKYSILKPDIFDEFTCKCGECRYTCCGDWRIDFSNEEYEKIIRKRKFGKDVESYFKDKENSKNEKTINLDKNGKCPFLDEQGLCGIQKKYGFDYLSETCKFYPRLLSKFKNIFEASLSTGCEKVLELLFEKKEGISLIEENIPVNKVYNYGKLLCNFTEENDIMQRPILKYWFDIKVLGLGVLMERSYTIEERLLLLGIAMKRIDELEKNDRVIEIPDYVNSFLENINGGSLKEDLNSFSKNEGLKVATAAFNIGILFYKKEKESIIIDEIFRNLGIAKFEPEIINTKDKYGNESTYYDFKTDIKYNNEAYIKCANNYDKYMSDKLYFFENYMVLNYIALQTPFKPAGNSIFENYKGFIMIFIILKFCIVGYMNDKKSFDEIVNLIAVVSRNLSHNDASINNINGILKSINIDSIAHMAVLLLS